MLLFVEVMDRLKLKFFLESGRVLNCVSGGKNGRLASAGNRQELLI